MRLKINVKKTEVMRPCNDMNMTIEASEVTEVGLLVQLLRYFGARFKLDGLRNEEMKSGFG